MTFPDAKFGRIEEVAGMEEFAVAKGKMGRLADSGFLLGELNLMGCDLGQGWLYGKAGSGEDVTAMLGLAAGRDASVLPQEVSSAPSK